MTSINDAVLLEFLNQNMHRNYPIQDTCVVKTANNVYLPSSFLVDCQIIVPCLSDQQSGIDTGRFFVYSVQQYTSSVQVIIGYQPETGDPFPCAASAAIVLSEEAQPPYPATVTLTPAAGIPDNTENQNWDPLRKLSGTIWIGTTAGMSNLGSLAFAYDDAKLRSTCIVKTLIVETLVRSLTIVDVNGTTLTELSGDVTLQAGEGIQIALAGGTLSISADEDWVESKIHNILTTAGAPIQTINGQKPDNSGNFTISGLDCLDVKSYSGTNGIGVSNTCSKPCCSEESGDLADIRSMQDNLEGKVDRISENLNSFINSINNVETRLPSLVASRK